MNKQEMIAFAKRGCEFYCDKLSEITSKNLLYKTYSEKIDFYESILTILNENENRQKLYYKRKFGSFS